VLVQDVFNSTGRELSRSERPLSDASGRFLGPSGASLIAAGAVVSILGTMNALMFATPRIIFAMAENRQLPRAFALTHQSFRTPTRAIALTAIIMLGLTLFSTFISALTISAVVRLMAYMTTCAALPTLRRDSAAPRPTYVLPGGSFISVAAVVLSIWLLTNSSWSELRLVAAAVGVGFVIHWSCARLVPEAQRIEPIAEPPLI